jgi:hypothetical protein
LLATFISPIVVAISNVTIPDLISYFFVCGEARVVKQRRNATNRSKLHRVFMTSPGISGSHWRQRPFPQKTREQNEM